MSTTEALQRIADMDPRGERADDLGRAASIARAALAAAAPSPLAGWQPIDTAPKERELLLFRADAGIFTGIWTSFSSFATQGECDICDEDVLFSEGWFYGDYRNCGRLDGSEEPTHWMELPLVPVWPLDESTPTAQPQPRPEPTVLFDDRPQNQRIAEAEERMRNPVPLQWEDGDPDATPEQMRYVSALDPVMQAINAQTEPDDLITVAHVECENGAGTLTLSFDQLGDLAALVGEDEETYTVRIAPMTRSDFEALGEFDGF